MSILGSLVAGATLADVVDAFHLVGAVLVAIAVIAGVIALFLGECRNPERDSEHRGRVTFLLPRRVPEHVRFAERP